MDSVHLPYRLLTVLTRTFERGEALAIRNVCAPHLPLHLLLLLVVCSSSSSSNNNLQPPAIRKAQTTSLVAPPNSKKHARLSNVSAVGRICAQ
jgi:hypothetical protein